MSTHKHRMMWQIGKDIRAVSEVVGSVLLLLMTVTVFSGIIIFVNSIQGPGNQTFVDLIPSIERTDANNGIIMITHAGGHPLDASTTAIIVVVNSTRYQLTVPDGLTPSNGQWATGQRWQAPFTGNTLSQNATVQLTVIDLNVNQIVLLALVQRGIGTGGTFPIIGTAAVVPNGFVVNDGKDPFKIRVVAVDYDNDLPRTGVAVDLSPLGCNVSSQTLVDRGFGVFESAFASTLTSCVAAKTYVVNITATDLAGHSSQGKLNLVVKSPTSGSQPQVGGTGPFGWLFTNEFQAYEIYNSTEWDSKRFNGTSTRTFVKGESVVIVLASQYLKNLNLQNDISVYGTSQVPALPIVYGGGAMTATSVPSSRAGFEFEEFIAGFFLYEARFSTSSDSYGYNGSQLSYGRYAVEFILRAENVDPPRNRFSTADEIRVTDADGGLPEIPLVETFADPGFTTPSNHFHFTDRVYVRLSVTDAEGGVTAGDVTISDYIGGVQIWARPGTNPVSAVAVLDDSHYSFSIDLTNPNFDPWIFGQNAYGFKIKQIIDVNEKYSFVAQLIIDGPEWALDVIDSISEFVHPTFSEKWYAVLYHNDQLWTPTVIEVFQPLPSQQNPAFGGGKFLDVALGDVDGDGDLDAVFALEVGRVFLYRNIEGDGLRWERSEIDYPVVPVLAVAMGRLDADTDADIVAGTNGGEVWLYDNDGSFTPRLVGDLGSEVLDIKISDVTGDGANDLLIATKGGEVRIYINDGFGSFGTLATQDYVLSADSTVEGTVTGTYTSTQSSNDVRQTIREVTGTGEVEDLYAPVGEFIPAYGTVESGTYANVISNDGTPYEVLAEEFYDGPGTGDKWLLRNSTAGAAPGHQYAFGTIPALGAGASATVTVGAFLSAGTEPIEIRYKVGAGAVSAVLGTFTEAVDTTKTFALTGFTGGQLYIVFQDSDTTNNDASSDGKQTKVSVDQVTVTVTRASGTTSRLEHKWQTASIGSGGDAYRLFVEANRTTSGESDDMLIEWSTASGGPWQTLVTVTKVVDDDVYQTALLPGTVGGTQIWVRVRDTNHAANATSLETVAVDSLLVRRYISVPNFVTISTGGESHAVTAGDIDGDSNKDVVVGAGSNVKIYYGPSWSTSTTLSAGSTVWDVDVGHYDGDALLDVVAVVDISKVYLWNNGLGWTRSDLADLAAGSFGKGVTVEAGDVDGDLWEDVVVGTETGYILWYRHAKGTTWETYTVQILNTAVYGLDLGDVDRGVIPDHAS